MEEVQFGPHTGLSDSDSKREMHEIPLHPTPGEVLTKIADIVAICLGLALLANLLIAPPPM